MSCRPGSAFVRRGQIDASSQKPAPVYILGRVETLSWTDITPAKDLAAEPNQVGGLHPAAFANNKETMTSPNA